MHGRSMSHNRAFAAIAWLLPAAIALAACGRGDLSTPPAAHSATTVSVTSTAFADGQSMPADYTCSGRGAPPPLAWSPVEGAAAWAITMDDPDASFTHWLAWNLPATTASLPAGGPLPAGTVEGKNDFGNQGYGGPCPPEGSRHHYVFRVYALDAPLTPAAGSGRDALFAAMAGHILAAGSLTGLFGR